ncbi:MAG: metallophosphoesterase [Candidatus Hodarchaeota archaeon]
MISQIVEKVAQYQTEDVLRLLEKVRLILRQEPLLVRLPKAPLVFIGDIHGDWEATQALLHRYWETPTVLVFLGDYVDRGPHQLENINLLYTLKVQQPLRVILLRGNHELPSINRSYGFYNEIQRVYGNISEKYWEVFAEHALAGVSQAQRLFAVHGGIPQGLDSIEEIVTLPREIEPENPITIQLLWNDPKEGLKRFAPSMRGSRIYYFGQEVTEKFMTMNNLDLIVRAHEVFPQGIKEFFQGRIVSLFSCRNYRGPIAGKVLYVDTTGQRTIVAV